MLQTLLIALLLSHPLVVAAILQKQADTDDIRLQGFSDSLSSDKQNDDRALHELNKTLGGRIMALRPVARPCYSIDVHAPFYQNATQCAILMANKTDDEFMIDQPAGYYSSNWAGCQSTGHSCAIPLKYNGSLGNYISPADKCNQGNVPDYYIDIAGASDVKHIFEAAPTLGRPIVIKNTGHDIKGRSAAPRALALWTHNLRSPKIPIKTEENFVPEGCPPPNSRETVFTFGAGETWGGLYEYADNQSLAVVGGTCGTVGIAGWLHGVGHSPLSTHYGLGVDNIRQVKIVLPKDGNEIVANDCQNEDVFRAVKGGGGGTFGLVTEMSYKALPKFNVQEFTLDLWGLDRENIKQFLNITTFTANALAKKGWGGYINTGRPNRSLTLINPRASQKEAAEDVRLLIEWARELDVTAQLRTHSSWYDYYNLYYAAGAYSGSTTGSNDASRLVPHSIFSNNETRMQLVNTLLDLHYDRLNFIIMPVTPAAFKDPRRSSLHQTWRDSPWLIRINDNWDPFYELGTPLTTARSFENVHQAMERIRKLIPNVGVSINEADIWEPNHTEAFWGQENYHRLLNVKRATDPQNILQTIQGVKAEPKDERFRCYPDRSLVEAKPSHSQSQLQQTHSPSEEAQSSDEL